MYLLNTDELSVFSNHKMTTDRDGFFYHKAILIDINQDGHMDILTARVKKPAIGKSVSNLVWLENPGGEEPY